MTLEQLRAEHAWKCCSAYTKEHENVAKSLPLLIMNSGLMQVLAFCEGKDGAYQKVSADLRAWLGQRFDVLSSSKNNFADFMEGLYEQNSASYQDISIEALAWLKWLRQMAPARRRSGGGA